MRSQSPLSFVSWNSELFLKSMLDVLLCDGRIDFYAYIHHVAEAEEKKDHFHVFMLPARTLDTDVIKPMFDEIDPKNDKPIQVHHIAKSNWYDWYWYGLHNPRYIGMKSIEPKKFIYSDFAMVVSDPDYFAHLKLSTPRPKNPADLIREAVIKGIPFDNLVDTGVVPINQIKQYESAYFRLLKIYDVHHYDEMKQQEIELENMSIANGDYRTARTIK